MPATVMFYHLTQKGQDETLTPILTRALGQGWRVMIRAPDAALLDHLDAQLWLGPEEGFLPHGLQGGPHDAQQPVLLGAGPITNGAQALFLLAGAQVEQVETAHLERVWLIFDGSDPASRSGPPVCNGRASPAGVWPRNIGRTSRDLG